MSKEQVIVLKGTEEPFKKTVEEQTLDVLKEILAALEKKP